MRPPSRRLDNCSAAFDLTGWQRVLARGMGQRIKAPSPIV